MVDSKLWPNVLTTMECDIVIYVTDFTFRRDYILSEMFSLAAHTNICAVCSHALPNRMFMY
jgi:hypothetical protein